MQRLIHSLAASACLVALLGAATPAHAQTFATFASGNGNDANTCLTPATACREIFGATGALAKTDEGGIIHVLPGEYIAFPVEKGVDIVADAGQASIYTTVAGGGGGIVVNVSGTQVVRIRGFLINSAHGIVINGSGVVHIEDSTLAGVEARYGILYQPTGAGELYVSGTKLTRSTVPSNSGGIQIKPTGSGSAKVVLDNILVEDNGTGILIDSRFTSGSQAVTIRNSTISGSASFAVAAYESGGGTSNVTIESSNITNNTASFGVGMSGAGATARLVNVTVTGNARGLLAASSSSIISHGGNVIAGNTINGAFTATVPPQ
jgi:hypothetical protein